MKLGRTPVDNNDIAEEDVEEEEEEDVIQGSPVHSSSLVVDAGASSPNVTLSQPSSPKLAIPVSVASTSAALLSNSNRRLDSGGQYKTTGQKVQIMDSSHDKKWSNRRLRKGTKHASFISRKYSSLSLHSVDGRASSAIHRSSLPNPVRVCSWEEEDVVRPEWALDQIELSDSDADLEFFDAKGMSVLLNGMVKFLKGEVCICGR